jgi:hypothetical protein
MDNQNSHVVKKKQGSQLTEEIGSFHATVQNGSQSTKVVLLDSLSTLGQETDVL